MQGANFRDLSGVIVGADNVAVRDPTIKPILLPSGHLLVSGPVASMDDYPSSGHANWEYGFDSSSSPALCLHF